MADVQARGWERRDVRVRRPRRRLRRSPEFSPTTRSCLSCWLGGGFRVAFLSQPAWKACAKPWRHFAAARSRRPARGTWTRGSTHYRRTRRVRNDDAYSPAAGSGCEPDPPHWFHCQRAAGGVPRGPVIAGGSRRRCVGLAHYATVATNGSSALSSRLEGRRSPNSTLDMGRAEKRHYRASTRAGQTGARCVTSAGVTYALGKESEELRTVFSRDADLGAERDAVTRAPLRRLRVAAKRFGVGGAPIVRAVRDDNKLAFAEATRVNPSTTNPFQRRGAGAVFHDPPAFRAEPGQRSPAHSRRWTAIYDLPFTRGRTRATPDLCRPRDDQDSVPIMRGCLGGLHVL